MLIQHGLGVMASAFQSQPQIGIAGHRHPRRLSYKHNVKIQWLQPHPTTSCAKSSYNHRSDVFLSATESDSSLEDMLENFAAPLEFKKDGDVYNKNKDASGSEKYVAPTSGGDDASSEVEGSLSATDEAFSSDTKTEIGSFAPSPDTPLANKYYLKKMQMAEEAKQTETPVKEKTTETADITTPAPSAPAPRRRFTDFGIASEQSEPPKGENTGTSASDADIASNVPDAKAGTEKSSAASTIKEGNSAAATSSTKKEKAPATASTTKEEKAAAAAESTAGEEKAPAAKSTPSSTATFSQPSSELLKMQPTSPISPLTLPSLKLDAGDFGLLPLITIGISLYLALGAYLKQVNNTDDGYSGWDDFQKKDRDEEGSGLLGKITGESETLIQKVKDAGTAGAISYGLWEAVFWGVSFPVCVVSYRQVTGHWPDVMNVEEARKIGLEAFAFANVARLAVPVRIGLALSTVPWVEENIVSRFQGRQVEEAEEEELNSEQVMLSTTLENVQSTAERYSGEANIEPARKEEQVIANVQDGEGNNSLRPQFPPSDDNIEEVEDKSISAISDVENRLNKMEIDASRITSSALDNINAGIDPTLLQKKKKKIERRYVPGNNYLGSINDYCEPGQVDEDCSESIQGYLDSLASTGAVATDGEVKAIVGYLDSVSSNVTPNKNTGAAFSSYLDALSTGYIPSPPSAKAVASYLDVLSSSDEIITSTTSPPATATGGGSKDEKIASRINNVEERLGRLESSVTSLPDDIASRLVDWQMNQDKRLSSEMEKIMKLLVDVKALDKQ